MNNKQKQFLGDYLEAIGLGIIMMSVSYLFIYFGKKLYGSDAILLAGMGVLFWFGMNIIAKVVAYSYSLGFNKDN